MRNVGALIVAVVVVLSAAVGPWLVRFDPVDAGIWRFDSKVQAGCTGSGSTNWDETFFLE